MEEAGMEDTETPSSRMAELVLYAEFDIDKGSTLRDSFPKPIPHYSPEFFADVMLPEGVHNRHEDFTIFFLNRLKHAPLAEAEPAKPTNEADGQDAGEDQELEKKPLDPLKQFLYCLSIVRTTHDTTARRGAKVNAVAVCSPHKHIFALKQVLDVAVTKLAAATSDMDPKLVLEELFQVINAVDTSGVRMLTDMERRLLKRTVTNSDGGFRALSSDAESSIYFHTSAQWQLQNIPLKFRMCSTDDQHDDGLLTKLLLKFGEQTMTIYNAVLTGLRVIVLGYNRPAGEICNYVLATSSLVCPPLSGLIHRQFPYANLTDLGFLSTPGYIAGVTNPMFKTKREWWDVLCDISTGEIFLSAPAEKDEYEAIDRNFVLEVLDGVHAGYDEEWVRCKFEEYTRQNVVDIAAGETNYLDTDTQVKRIAINNKRITRWARTDNYKFFTEARKRAPFASAAFNISSSSSICLLSLYGDVCVLYVEKTGVDLKKYLRSLQGGLIMLDDVQVERMYTDFVQLLHTEEELQEFLSYLPLLRGGLQSIAQGIFHSSISVKYNTVILLKRLEKFPSTASSLRLLNAFIMMSYQRMHNIVQPDVRAQIHT